MLPDQRLAFGNDVVEEPIPHGHLADNLPGEHPGAASNLEQTVTDLREMGTEP